MARKWMSYEKWRKNHLVDDCTWAICNIRPPWDWLEENKQKPRCKACLKVLKARRINED